MTALVVGVVVFLLLIVNAHWTIARKCLVVLDVVDGLNTIRAEETDEVRKLYYALEDRLNLLEYDLEERGVLHRRRT